MGIGKRVTDMTRAAWYERLEQSEDPVRVIDRYLHEQHEHIKQSEGLYQQCLQHTATLRQQMAAAEAMRDKREQQAMLALKAGEEHMARLALQEKLQAGETHTQYAELYRSSQAHLSELEVQLEELRADYREVYAKRQYYAARLETVRLQQRMNERLRAGSTIGQQVFHRLEDRVTGMEHEAQALREVRRIGADVLRGVGSSLGVLEQELEKLRQKLNNQGGERR